MVTNAELLHLAAEIACEAHKGQSDKQGEPYIFHVMRVALAMRTDEERVVALLEALARPNQESARWASASCGGSR